MRKENQSIKMSCTKRLNVCFDYEIATNFVTSQWQKNVDPSLMYLIYNWILAAYFNFVLVLSIYTAELCEQLNFYPIYLTNWNVILNATSSLFGAILVTLYYHQTILFATYDVHVHHKHRMPTFLKLYWFLSNLSTVVSISVAIIYWQSYNGRDAGLNDILTHAVNATILFVDTFIHARSPRYGHFIYPLCFGILYVIGFSLPYQLFGGLNRDFKNYIYPSLDWTNNTKGAIMTSIMFNVASIVVHFIITFSMSIRLKLHNKLHRNDPTSSNHVSLSIGP